MNLLEKAKKYMDAEQRHKREMEKLEREEERLTKLVPVEEKKAKIYKMRAKVAEARHKQRENSAFGSALKALSEMEVGELNTKPIEFEPVNFGFKSPWEVEDDAKKAKR